MKPPHGSLYCLLKEHEEQCWSTQCSLTVSSITADQSAKWAALLKLPAADFTPLAKAYLKSLCPATLPNKHKRQAVLKQLVEVPGICKAVGLAGAELIEFKDRLIEWACSNTETDTLTAKNENLREKLIEAKVLANNVELPPKVATTPVIHTY